jgi:hypothetical protein
LGISCCGGIFFVFVLFCFYLLTLDPKDERSVGVVAEGTSQRRASLRVPLQTEQLAMGSSVLLPRLKRPARSFNQTKHTDRHKIKEKEEVNYFMKNFIFLRVQQTNPNCQKEIRATYSEINKSKNKKCKMHAHFHATIDTDRNWIGSHPTVFHLST